jgi:predicted permease
MPDWKPEILRRLAPLKLAPTREAEIVDELSQHLEDRYQELVANGQSEDAAFRTSLDELRGEELLARSLRTIESSHYREPITPGKVTGSFFSGLLQDFRYGLRMARKSPGFTVVAILTLALGIGANTTIFSMVNGVMLSALPVPDAQRLVVLHWTAKKRPKSLDSSGFGDCDVERDRGEGAASCSISYPMFQALQSRATAFSSVAAFAGPVQLALSGNGAPSTVQAMLATGDYFETLEVRAALGRTITPSDDTVAASPVVVLSYGYWRSAFGGSPSVIGRSVFLNNIAFTIVGVADASFTTLTPGKSQDMWVPATMAPRLTPADWEIKFDSDHSVWLLAVARLKLGVSMGQAQAAADVIFRNEVLHGAKPLFTEDADPRMAVTRAWSALSGERNRMAEPIYILGLTVGTILLIACANVAGLMLARAAGREKEMAVRRALGARRGRIVRQLLTESILLSAIGGALGIAFAWWGRDVLVSLLRNGSEQPLSFSFGIDVRVLAFTASASIFAGILFGLAPALRSARADLTPVLKQGTGSSSSVARPGGRWLSAGNGLVVAQIALSIVVLAGAGLLVRTLENLRSINPGFDPQNVLLFGIDPTLLGYSPMQTQNLYRDLQSQLAAVPGVTSVSYSSDSLLSNGWWSTGFHIEGRPANENAGTDMLAVSPEFFSTMHIPLRAGRAFTPADMAQAVSAAQTPKGAAASPTASQVPLAMMVNESFARKYFPNQNPLGKQATRSGRTLQIVGVAGDTKYADLRTPVGPLAFVPAANRGVRFEVRTAMDPTALVSTVRKVAARVDSAVPLFDMLTQTEQIGRLLMQERLIARLSSFFGALALVLACVGLYGLLSYEVARRTREIGIRMALGAQRGDLLRLVVGQGILLALIGAAIGVGTAIGVTRFMSSMLYGIHAGDPVTFAAVAILLALVALAACYIPARRAMRVDPMVALRYE